VRTDRSNDDRDELANAVTSPEDTKAQFLHWEKLRMNALLAKRKRDQETKMAPAQQSSSVFDDAYIDGKLQSMPCTNLEKIPLSYIKSFCAELSTAR
jgi:hypothetical protein